MSSTQKSKKMTRARPNNYALANSIKGHVTSRNLLQLSTAQHKAWNSHDSWPKEIKRDKKNEDEKENESWTSTDCFWLSALCVHLIIHLWLKLSVLHKFMRGCTNNYPPKKNGSHLTNYPLYLKLTTCNTAHHGHSWHGLVCPRYDAISLDVVHSDTVKLFRNGVLCFVVNILLGTNKSPTSTKALLKMISFSQGYVSSLERKFVNILLSPRTLCLHSSCQSRSNPWLPGKMWRTNVGKRWQKEMRKGFDSWHTTKTISMIDIDSGEILGRKQGSEKSRAFFHTTEKF